MIKVFFEPLNCTFTSLCFLNDSVMGIINSIISTIYIFWDLADDLSEATYN